MRVTFRGGVHLEEYKELSLDPSIRKAAIPKRVSIPLLQHTGAPCKSLVKVGDTVKLGQLIGKSDKFISSPIHATISGKVIKVEKTSHTTLGEYDAILIEGDGSESFDDSLKARHDVNRLTKQEILDIIKQAGIVGMGGAAFPTHVKLSPPKDKPIDSVILNGAECEPYLTCDHRLMLEKSSEIVEGLKIITNLVGARQAYIAIESNKMGAVFTLEKVIKKSPNIKIKVLKTKYPQGSEKQLIKVVLGREVPPGGLPLDVGCIVQNVGTALSIYEALYKGKALYERVVTISGDCIKEPSNLLARIGSPIRELVDQCKGFKKEPSKVIVGGPMMGITQFNLDAPIIKGTTGIIFLSSEAIKEYPETNCIRCARCVDACPVNLIPADIFRFVKKTKYQSLSEYNITDCIECGCCSYECPSKIPLVQWIKLGKSEYLKLKGPRAK